MASSKINCCRLCGHQQLTTVMDLGEHRLSSRFPAADEPDPISVPLILVKCDDRDNDACGLIQLSHTTSSDELYLHHYGYRSGLNQTMINHLTELVKDIESKIQLHITDVVLDIGSNDSTLLKSYTLGDKLCRVGIDPTGLQFKQYYPGDVHLIPDFFTQQVYESKLTRSAKVVSSISMFYDLENPTSFSRDIKEILAPDGIWVCEQSYAVSMMKQNSFDTVCHEHLEYYTLKQFDYICQQVGLKIIDVTKNDCNGGSFRVTMTHQDNDMIVDERVQQFRQAENDLMLSNFEVINAFCQRVEDNKTKLVDFIKQQKEQGKIIYLYSASTKGNTLLQYYGLNNKIITAAAERNPEKYGRRTPGTNIPIISEAEMRLQKPDYLLVMAWAFRWEFIAREKQYMEDGGTIIFPLPKFESYPK